MEKDARSPCAAIVLAAAMVAFALGLVPADPCFGASDDEEGTGYFFEAQKSSLSPFSARDRVPTRGEILDRLAEGENESAAEMIDVYLAKRPHDPIMQYNAACVRCRLDETDIAAKHLLEAIKAGFNDFSHMRRDDDLRPLHDHQMYRAILAARDAADELLALRRIDRWRDRLPHGRYQQFSDPALRLTFLTMQPEDEFESTRFTLRQEAALLGQTMFPTSIDSTALIVIVDRESVADLLGDAHAHGVYRHRAGELITTGSQQSLSHEFVHLLHHRHMDAIGQEHPMWIQEGLATLFEEYEIRADGATDFPPNQRQNLAKRMAIRGDLLSWDELVHIDRRRWSAQAPRVYPQLRTFFRYLASEGLVEPWYARYVELYDQDPSGVKALEGAAGRPMAQLDAEWRAWLDRQPMIVVKTEPDRSESESSSRRPVPVVPDTLLRNATDPMADNPAPAGLELGDAHPGAGSGAGIGDQRPAGAADRP